MAKVFHPQKNGPCSLFLVFCCCLLFLVLLSFSRFCLVCFSFSIILFSFFLGLIFLFCYSILFSFFVGFSFFIIFFGLQLHAAQVQRRGDLAQPRHVQRPQRHPSALGARTRRSRGFWSELSGPIKGLKDVQAFLSSGITTGNTKHTCGPLMDL